MQGAPECINLWEGTGVFYKKARDACIVLMGLHKRGILRKDVLRWMVQTMVWPTRFNNIWTILLQQHLESFKVIKRVVSQGKETKK